MLHATLNFDPPENLNHPAEPYRGQIYGRTENEGDFKTIRKRQPPNYYSVPVDHIDNLHLM